MLCKRGYKIYPRLRSTNSQKVRLKALNKVVVTHTLPVRTPSCPICFEMCIRDRGLIVLGALVAYQNILMNTLGDIVWRWGKNSPFFRALYLMMDQLPEIVVCVALIICGAWLVRGPKGRKPKQKAADADFTEYAAQDVYKRQVCAIAAPACCSKYHHACKQ